MNRTEARTRLIFRVVAIAEAFSWLGLLIGMFVRGVLDNPDLGPTLVSIFGAIHGGIFIAYVVVTFWTARVFRWKATTLVLGLLSSIPPFFTVLFEVWVDRRGLLGIPATATGDARSGVTGSTSSHV